MFVFTSALKQNDPSENKTNQLFSWHDTLPVVTLILRQWHSLTTCFPLLEHEYMRQLPWFSSLPVIPEITRYSPWSGTPR